MDRPKHRLLFPLLLLAAGVLLLFLARQQRTPIDVMPATDATSTPQLVDPQHAATPSPAVDTAAQLVTPPAPSATTSRDFRGRVIDAATRQPIREFEVQLIRVRRDQHTEDLPIVRNFNSVDGRFVWPNVEEGTWRAAVSAAGYQMFNLDDQRFSETEHEIVMPMLRGFAIRGRVIASGTGAGIADAYISSRSPAEQVRFGKSGARAQSGADGSFVLDGVPSGDRVLSVGAKDYAFREVAVFVDEKTPPQEIALSAGASIAGMVTTTAGVPVKAMIGVDGPGPMGYGLHSDDAGQFSLKNLQPGRYRISARADAGSVTQSFVLEDGAEQNITLVVGGGRRVHGTITGLPVERLQNTVVSLTSESGKGSSSARPDERGAYTLNSAPVGRGRLALFAEGLHFEKWVEVPTDRDITIDMAFAGGARLSGCVTRSGKPVVGSNVWLIPAVKNDDLFYRAMTSIEGAYEISGVPKGDYRLKVDEDVTRIFSMSDEDAVMNIDIPASQLSGRLVEDGSAVPIVGANVYVRGSAPETTRVKVDQLTDDFGRFTLTGIEPGEIVLVIYKPGYSLHLEQMTYRSPVADRSISLRRSAGVEVRVKAGSRRFPQGFRITLRFPGSEQILDLWMPKNREGICYVPGELAGTTFQIGRFTDKPIVIEAWDGQPFELQ